MKLAKVHTIHVFWPFEALCSYKLCSCKKTCYWFDKEQRKQFDVNLALRKQFAFQTLHTTTFILLLPSLSYHHKLKTCDNNFLTCWIETFFLTYSLHLQF